jgi:hypothetical protein
VYSSCRFPCVVTFGVSFPFDEILELSGMSMMSVVPYLLHFIFFFSADEFQGWPHVVSSMGSGFMIG